MTSQFSLGALFSHSRSGNFAVAVTDLTHGKREATYLDLANQRNSITLARETGPGIGTWPKLVHCGNACVVKSLINRFLGEQKNE